jgi:hypothetical protein
MRFLLYGIEQRLACGGVDRVDEVDLVDDVDMVRL